MQHFPRGGQRARCRSWFSPSTTRVWGLSSGGQAQGREPLSTEPPSQSPFLCSPLKFRSCHFLREVLPVLCWAQVPLPQAPRTPPPQTAILGTLCHSDPKIAFCSHFTAPQHVTLLGTGGRGSTSCSVQLVFSSSTRVEAACQSLDCWQKRFGHVGVSAHLIY